MRAVSLVLDFTTGVNLNFLQVTAMTPMPVWGGETIYLPTGVFNPSAVTGQLSNLLLVLFIFRPRIWSAYSSRS